MTISLFGSVARDEASDGSDIDLLVEFADPATFDNYIALKEFLESLLGNQVDLITRKSVKPRFAEIIERDLVDVA
jgi:predicted nucleotidyltransferase